MTRVPAGMRAVFGSLIVFCGVISPTWAVAAAPNVGASAVPSGAATSSASSNATSQGRKGVGGHGTGSAGDAKRQAANNNSGAGGSSGSTTGANGSPPQDAQTNASTPYNPLWLLLMVPLIVGIAALLRSLNAASAIDRRQRDVLTWLGVMYVVGLIVPAFLPLHGSDWVVVDFVAAMVSLGAAFFGFLFGLPQAAHDTAGTAASGTTGSAALSPTIGPRKVPSTNLETVADGLTKFITGAAFASIAVAAGYIGNFGSLVAGAFTSPAPPSGALIGDMVLVGYATLGFTISYIVTRTALSLSFQQADRQLLNEASIIIASLLPDVGPADLTDEQRDYARKVATVPYDSLHYDEERLTWARAQTIVGDWTKARIALGKLFASDAGNADIVIEYATALYNENPKGNQDLVLSLLKTAQPSAGNDPRRLSRIAALTAAANLYVSGGYVVTIETANGFLKTGVPPSRNLRFYRACAFGQLYRAYNDAKRLSPNDETEIDRRITSDSAITVAFGDTYRQELRDVAVPSKDSPDDDDLVAFTAKYERYAREVLGLDTLPAYPQPKPSGEPRLVDPLPGGKTPAQLASESPT